MLTDSERRGLTEPLESVTAFFGGLMIIAALVGAAFLVLAPAVTAQPGHSISIIGNLQVCADLTIDSKGSRLWSWPVAARCGGVLDDQAA